MVGGGEEGRKVSLAGESPTPPHPPHPPKGRAGIRQGAGRQAGKGRVGAAGFNDHSTTNTHICSTPGIWEGNHSRVGTEESPSQSSGESGGEGTLPDHPARAGRQPCCCRQRIPTPPPTPPPTQQTEFPTQAGSSWGGSCSAWVGHVVIQVCGVRSGSPPRGIPTKVQWEGWPCLPHLSHCQCHHTE